MPNPFASFSSAAALDIIINPQGAVSGGQVVQRSLDTLKHGFLDLTAKIYVAQRALDTIWKAAEQGARFEETMARLNRQTAAFHTTAQAMVGDLQAISRQTLAIDKAATIASRALAVGLDPSQVKTFLQASMLLKDVMQTELPQAFDDIVQAAISGRATILGNIKIFVDMEHEIRQLAASTGRYTEQVSKQEKVQIVAEAITKQLANSTNRLTDGMKSDADRLNEVKASWENFWVDMGRLATKGVLGVIDAYKKWQEFKKSLWAVPGNLLSEFGLMPKGGEMFGPPAPSNLGLNIPPPTNEPPIPAPASARIGELQAQAALRDRIRQGELDRTQAQLKALAELYDADADLQIETAEDVVRVKGELRLQEIAAQLQSLNQQLANENQLNVQLKNVANLSTEDKLAEEKRHNETVVNLTQQMYGTLQALSIQANKNEAERRQARANAEKALGERQTQQGVSNFAIAERQRQEDFEGVQTYYQGLMDMASAQFASDAEIARKERELLREQLAFKLRITVEEADRVLFLRKAGRAAEAAEIAGRGDPTLSGRAVEGIVDSATARDIRAMERANDDFFAGWKRGLQDYSQSRNTAFSLSVDMARRTAQAMEQGFETFFFDMFNGKIASLKDALVSLLDFTKRIIAQIIAQLVTVGIIRAVTSLFGPSPGGGGYGGMMGVTRSGVGGMFGATGGEVVRRFDRGGPVLGSGMRDTIPAYLTPGEWVLSRNDVADIKRGTAGRTPIAISITVNADGARHQSSSDAQPNFAQLARDLSKLVENKLIEEQRPGGLLSGRVS